MVRLGLALPAHPAAWRQVVALGQQAEALGWASLWLPDPGVCGAPAEPGSLDPLVALAGLARVTGRARLGTLALDAGLRSPGALANAVATVDRLSGGRVTVGLAPPDDGPDGTALLGEVLAVLRTVFAGGPLDHAGRFFGLDGLRIDPGPVQRPGPPLWVVGRSEALLDLAAAAADGWNDGTWVTGPEAYEGSRRADAACRRAGRDPASLGRSANWLAGGWRGGLAEAVAGWAAVGVSDVVVASGALPFGVTSTDDIARVASATELGVRNGKHRSP